MKQEVIPTDIYQDGDLIGIEFNNLEGGVCLSGGVGPDR